jgi:hypothetical protein
VWSRRLTQSPLVLASRIATAQTLSPSSPCDFHDSRSGTIKYQTGPKSTRAGGEAPGTRNLEPNTVDTGSPRRVKPALCETFRQLTSHPHCRQECLKIRACVSVSCTGPGLENTRRKGSVVKRGEDSGGQAPGKHGCYGLQTAGNVAGRLSLRLIPTSPPQLLNAVAASHCQSFQDPRISRFQNSSIRIPGSLLI